MYGDNYDIPAFRWFDRQAGRVLVSNRPDGARMIEGRYGAGRRGLLADGSSVSNLITGQARTSMLTVSDIGDGRPSGRVEDLLLFLLNPYCLLRVTGLVLWDLLMEWGGAWRQRLRSFRSAAPNSHCLNSASPRYSNAPRSMRSRASRHTDWARSAPDSRSRTSRGARARR